MPEKALKTRLFFDMIGALSEEVIHNLGILTHKLWKVVWISTTYPQAACAYADNHKIMWIAYTIDTRWRIQPWIM